MASLDIKDRFLDRFAAPLEGVQKRRIVIWHDADGEFEEDFDAMLAEAEDGLIDGEGTRKIRFLKIEDGSMFSAKRLILRGDIESDFALYRKRASGDIYGDMLADIELYADHFQADGMSLLIQSLGVADTFEIRDALSQLRAFFTAKDRVARFASVMPHAQTAQDVYVGVLAASLGKAEPTSQSIIRAYALAALTDDEQGEPGKTLQDLERFGADDVLRRYIEGVTGYKGGLADIWAFMSHLLLSAFAATVPADLMSGLEGRYSKDLSQFCLGIVHDWAESSESDRSKLAYAAKRVQDDLDLGMRLFKSPISSLLASDVFPAAGLAIIRDLATSLAQGADRRTEVREAASIRRTLSDYGSLAVYFDALEAACDMQDFLRDHADGYHEAPASAVWKAYTQDWWWMDLHYRHFCEASRKCIKLADPDVAEAMESLVDWADNQYTHGFMIPANDCWVAMSEGDWQRDGYIQGIPRQRRFYDEIVENELSGVKRLVVIISDALRYEVARELARNLQQSQRVACDIDAVQGTFPSITSFGMAALLPHRSMSVDMDGKLDVFVDGMPTVSTKQREEVLKARRSASVAVSAKNLLDMKAAELKEFARDAEVIYIYHNAIDAIGEDSATEHDVFDACERAIDDISGLVRIATNQIKTTRIVITADHGFLYTHQEVPLSDKLAQGAIASDAERVGERFAIVPEGRSDDLLVNLSLEAVGGDDVVGLAPRGFVRINRPGGVSHYAHGGISLEELCVPVVRVRYGGSRSTKITDADYAEVRLLDTNRRITSMLFGIRLYQSEPVGPKVTPVTYELVLTDGSGNQVSDVRRIAADRSSEDEQERITEVRFALREGVAYKASESYYLTARNGETGEVAWREPFTIDIAFAPIDDFGF